MLYYISFFVAQVQTISVAVVTPIAISVAGVVVSIVSIRQHKNKMEAENQEKLATKDYVLDKVSKVDADVVAVKNDLQQHKHSNEREHDKITKDIDQKLDLIIELVKSK